MRFKGLDLNLLQALEVLLDERHVSRAAERMNMTQPAMSGALTRLRDYFDDPLLVKHGRQMIPTSHALSLRSRLKRVLADVDGLIAQMSHFDAATSERTFAVIASDYVVSLLFSRLSRRLRVEAPNISFAFFNPSEQSTRKFEQGEIDLLITPEHWMNSTKDAEVLYSEKQVILGSKDNPVMHSSRLSIEEFLSCGQVVSELGRVRRESYVESHLKDMDIPRRVVFRVSSFLAAPELLVDTALLTITHERFARQVAPRLGLKIADPPFDMPPMTQMMACHEARQDDPGVVWLKEMITQTVQEVNRTLGV